VATTATTPARGTVFGAVRGIVHDPDHRPVARATVVLRAAASQWSQSGETNANGEFQFSTVPVGEYIVTVSAPGFAEQQQRIAVSSGSAPILHFALSLAKADIRIDVTAESDKVDPQSSTPTTTVSREQIDRTPGGDRTNSLAMITDYVPGAYMVHDQLHLRGGHQVEWLVDGVPVPNTNIATNVGPQFDPKDIDYLEVQRGGFSSEYGDRTFGVFNVVTRSGFERNHEGELVLNYGSFHATNDQISFGSHTERFAYYASLNGNRSDLGLEPPAPQVLHDLNSGFGGFTSLIFNATPADQLRLVASARADHYQVPNTPDQQRAGIRDVERERDAFVNFSWLHTIGAGVVLTVSPFYHFNRAAYDGGANDPIIPQQDRGSTYAGGVFSLALVKGKHNAHAGFQAFGQHDNERFALTDPPAAPLQQRNVLWGNLESAYIEDQYRATSWLTFNGGLRLTRFAGALTETAADPRIGAAVRIPRVNWVVRGFYGRYYQAPPLATVAGPLLDFAVQQGFGFSSLRGERDEQYEFGVSIPVGAWVFESDYYHTAARNFFDHDALGNSNIFLPLTIARARLRGWEATLRSPRLFHRAQLHAAFAHQYAQGKGGVSGGLTDFAPPEDALFFLDHDRRDTLSAGFSVNLPWRSWASGDFSYGSGFLDGDGPQHLPAHNSLDVAVGKSFGEKWSVRVSALNVTNQRYLLDNSNTFGGTHYAYPRQVAAEVRYRFRY
jgi:outer membrane receptor protein involved in Fe transport